MIHALLNRLVTAQDGLQGIFSSPTLLAQDPG